MNENHLIADIPVKAILEKDGKVLLTLDHNGMWELPGGRMNDGENIEQALKRELVEELGLNIKIERIVDAFNFTSDSGKNHIVIIYKCSADNLDELKIMDGEVKDLKWTGESELSNLPMRQYKDVLMKYFKRYAETTK